MAFIDLNPERNDSDQQLLRKILKSLNLWLGGIVPSQSGNITVDTSAGVSSITVTPVSGGSMTTDRVGGYTTINQYSPVLTAVAYTAGDALGSTTSLDAILRPTVGTGILQSISVYDAAGQSAAIDFLIFSSEPASSTVTNNSPVVVDTSDVAKLLGKVSVAATDYVATAGGPTIATVSNVGLVLDSDNATGTIWVVPMTQGTPTYAASSLAFTIGVLQD